MKNLKYFCRKCTSVQSPAIESFTNSDGKEEEKEIIKTFEISVSNGEEDRKRTFTGRKLTCQHFISVSEPAFTDQTNENLNESETLILRSSIDKTMLGKTNKEIEQQILIHCETYKTLLKIATKQKQQAKYAIQYLDQLRERYGKLMTEDEKMSFEMKFAHFLELKPTSTKTIERERSSTDKEVDKQKAALESVKALLAKSGYKAKDLFSDNKE